MCIRNQSLFTQICHLNVKCDTLCPFGLDEVGLHDTRFKERDGLFRPQFCSGQTASTDSRAEHGGPLAKLNPMERVDCPRTNY